MVPETEIAAVAKAKSVYSVERSLILSNQMCSIKICG